MFACIESFCFFLFLFVGINGFTLMNYNDLICEFIDDCMSNVTLGCVHLDLFMRHLIWFQFQHVVNRCFFVDAEGFFLLLLPMSADCVMPFRFCNGHKKIWFANSGTMGIKSSTIGLLYPIAPLCKGNVWDFFYRLDSARLILKVDSSINHPIEVRPM